MNSRNSDLPLPSNIPIIPNITEDDPDDPVGWVLRVRQVGIAQANREWTDGILEFRRTHDRIPRKNTNPA